MARFALYSNGKKLETLEGLKENFTIKDMENNFRTKSLHRWLAEKGLRDELKKIENIPSDSDRLGDLLMECFALSDEQKAAVKQRAEEEAKRICEEQESKSKESKNNTGFFGYLFGDQMENLSRQVGESFSWLSRYSQNVPKVQSKQPDAQDRFEKDNSEEGLSDYEEELLTDIDPAEFREYLRNSSLMQLQCIEAILNKHANAGHPVAQCKKELWSEYNDEKLKQL